MYNTFRRVMTVQQNYLFKVASASLLSEAGIFCPAILELR
jgi:hypothetical protein